MTKGSRVLVSLLAGVLSVAASAPVAMRVELEPRRQVGDMTEVAVVVQVSPEDRIRIGTNAIVRIELDGGVVSSGSPMRAVRLEDDGSTRVVVEWPPGEHHLRVEIEDPGKEDTGLWVGTVRIPDLGQEAGDREIDEPQFDPEPDPDPDPEPENHEPVTPPPADAEDAIGASAAAAAAPTPAEPPVPEPSWEPSPEAEELEPVEAAVEGSPEPPAEEVTAIVGSAAVGEAATPESSEPVAEEKPLEIDQAEPEPVAVAESVPVEPAVEETPPLVEESAIDEAIPDVEQVPTAAEVETEAPMPEEPVEIEEEPPLVEPLRADPPPQTAKPEAVTPPRPVEPEPAMVPVSAELAARYEEWESADPDVREFSMIVTRGREPARDVEVGDIQLRVDGSRVPVERLGGAENAPLLLGLAIDVAADEVDNWSGMQGSLSPIVERAGGGRGQLFVATPVGVGAWDAEPDAPGRETGSTVSYNVARLVIASIERYRNLRGRTFLVVLTDGRIEPTKEEWRKATETAGDAGVPILVIALWDGQFNNRIRKNLKKMTEVSGGSLFLVQGRDQLESAADRFGRYLDGGYSLRFRSLGGDRQTATAISVSASDKQLDISAPKTIR
jgi:hypothetical protein